MTRDNNIYGLDSNDFAESVAADALTPVAGAAGSNLSDYWGKTTDDRATGKGNTPKYDEDAKVMILRKEQAGGGDNEALNASVKGGARHRKGPSTSSE